MDVVTLLLPGGRPCAMRMLTGWWERLRGLIGTDATAAPVLLVHCASIHTYFMRYPLDVAFLAPDGTVLAAFVGVVPGRVRAVRGARHVLERPHASAPWLREGSRVVVTLAAHDP